MFNIGKTNGFGFPIGVKVGNVLLNFLIKHCGFLSYAKGVIDGIMYDKIGKSSRPAVQGVEIIGDGNTWIDCGASIIYNQVDDIIIEFNVETTVSLDKRFYAERNRSGNGNPFYGLGSGNADATMFRIFIRNDVGTPLLDVNSTSIVFDGNFHECVYKDIGGVVTLTVDGIEESLGSYTRESIDVEGSSILAAFTTVATSIFDGNLAYLKLNTYTLDTQSNSDGVYTLQPSDKSVEPILAQQFLAPATPTQINTDVISLQDTYGYTNAIRNELDNYDFSDGANGWSGAMQRNVVDNQLINLATSQFQNTRQIINMNVDGDVWFFNMNIFKTSNSIQIFMDDGIVRTQHTNANTLNEFSDYYAKKTISIGSTTLNVTVQDNRSSGFDNIIIEGDITKDGGVFSLNLSEIDRLKGTNYAFMTASEINDIKYDLLDLQLYHDALATILISTGEQVANYPDGITSLAYISAGVHPVAQYLGRCKYDFNITDIAGTLLPAGDFVDGNYFKSADKYHELIIADTTNILYDGAGEPKIIEISTVANITNQQLFVNKDTEQVGFFAQYLEESCYTKAGLFFGLIEGLFDIDLIPLFDEDGDRLYVLKDSTTIE